MWTDTNVILIIFLLLYDDIQNFKYSIYMFLMHFHDEWKNDFQQINASNKIKRLIMILLFKFHDSNHFKCVLEIFFRNNLDGIFFHWIIQFFLRFICSFLLPFTKNDGSLRDTFTLFYYHLINSIPKFWWNFLSKCA